MCDVIVRVDEKKRVGLHVGGFVQGTEGTCSAHSNAPPSTTCFQRSSLFSTHISIIQDALTPQ